MDIPLAGDHGLLRTLNARAVLEVLDTDEPQDRVQIAAATGLSRPTVTQTLRGLVDSGAVVEAHQDGEHGAPSTAIYRLEVDRAFALAVDLGRRTIRAALVDITGTVRSRAEAPAVGPDPLVRARVVAGLAARCVAVLDPSVDLGAIHHAVVGVPAIVSPDGVAVRRVPGHEKGGAALHDALEHEIGCSVVLENDVNVAALAEQRLGAGRGAHTFVELWLGDGFGSGLVIGDRLHRGAAGGAGEISFLPQPGQSLGAETIGPVAITALLVEAGLAPDLSVAQVVELDVAGDDRAGFVLDEVCSRLAVIAAQMTLVLEPELFVLAGAGAHDAIVGRVRTILSEQLAVLPIRVAPSTVGTDAVVQGAAGLARDALREATFRAAVAAVPARTPEIVEPAAEGGSGRSAEASA
ncbi:ROK family transcriptional regulator [Oerskovia flava]|uniref:ROK family transcriptional regulator n=1 Tax=Oerskovia flava TaxID=2986422 RepID=UPI00223F3D5A|nr:ROK family protein [Oerskovia sp. JB1-3-2]